MRTPIIQTSNINSKELISIITGVGIALAGIVALLSYLNQKKHDELKKENAKLENEIKKLTLAKLKYDVTGNLS